MILFIVIAMETLPNYKMTRGLHISQRFHFFLIHYLYKHFLQKEPFSTITMQPQENPARVLLGLHGNSTERFLLKNLCCLDCIVNQRNIYTFHI